MAEDELSQVSGDAGAGQGEPAEPAGMKPAAVEGKGLGDIHTYIGSRLRQAFDDIASQPVPDRFLRLMQDLDKA